MKFTQQRIARFFLLAGIALSAGSAAAQNTPKVNGEIRKVDLDTGKLTIHHDAIPNLGMAGMTMVFRVTSPAMLAQLKSGDLVQFTADRIDGALTVTSIAPK